DTLHAIKQLIVNNSLKIAKEDINNFAEVSTKDTAVTLVLQKEAAGQVVIGTVTVPVPTPLPGQAKDKLTVIGNTRLQGDARIDGNTTINGNLKVTGALTGITGFDSLHVQNKIKIGNSIIIDATPLTTNNIYTDNTIPTDLLIQSKAGIDHNTLFNTNNAGKVGIGSANIPGTGYISPIDLKLDVAGHARFYSTSQDQYLRIGHNGTDAIIDNFGNRNLLINWYSGKNVVIGNDNDRKNVDGGLTIWENLGIGTDASTDQALKLHIKGYTYHCDVCPIITLEPPIDPVIIIPEPLDLPLTDIASASAKIRIEDEVYGTINRNVMWDFTASSNNNKFFITQTSSDNNTRKNIMTFTETGRVGINILSPAALLHVYQPTQNQNEVAIALGKINGRSMFLVPYLGDGGYNPIAKEGDVGIIFRNHYQNNSNSGLVIAPHNSQMKGIRIDADGKVGIGTGDPQYKLDVAGTIRSYEIITELTQCPDFVFDSDYKLMSLVNLENYLKINKHLPDIPSASEIKDNGFKVTEMGSLMLQKIEELTLYIIDLKKENETQQKMIDELKIEIKNYKNLK
ncbi:MAG: hypothetical protein WC599_13835, partial [Bacteroidales bacterium]